MNKRILISLLALASLAFGEKSNIEFNADDLYNLISQADRMVVTANGIDGVFSIFESSKEEDIKSFSDSLTLVPPTGTLRCMCSGHPKVHFYKGETELITLSNHHGLIIRCSLWETDIRIKDSEKWIAWFADRNMKYVRAEYHEAKQQMDK
jgi:hypothetical protein